MTDAIAASGEAPLNIEMGAGNAAGAAFQTTFVIDADAVLLQTINIGRTEVKTGLLLTIPYTLLAINYPKMAFFIYLKTVQE
jgi:hypothetical protein